MKYYLILIISLFSSLSYAQDDVDVFLIARNTGEKVLANNDTIRVFGFAEDLSSHPSIPGPTIYAKEGDSVHIDLWNVSQGAPHTIHLHGLDVDQQNDGVPHLSFEVEHMDHGFYHFKAPHAGTYLYHCHVASTVHVQAGMYGLIIIKPTDGTKQTWNDGYTYANEFAFMTSEIDTVWHHDSVLNHGHGPNSDPVKIPIYNPQFFLVNGHSDQQIIDQDVKVKSGQNQNSYLRFANIGFFANEVIFPSSLNAKIVASDGRPLPEVEVSDTLTLFPGERYGVLINNPAIGTDSILLNFRDLNTNRLWNTQFIPYENVEVLNIEQTFDSELVVYPNPFTKTIDVVSKVVFDAITVIDLNGRMVFEQKIESKVSTLQQIDLALSPGLYNLVLWNNDLQVGQKKIVRL